MSGLPEECSELYDHECEECGVEFRSNMFYDPDETILCDDCITNQEEPLSTQ